MESRYCSNGEFAGVMGSMLATKYSERAEEDRCYLMVQDGTICDDDDETPFIKKPVRTFVITAFDDHCDMEHG